MVNEEDKIEDLYNELVVQLGVPAEDYLLGKINFLFNDEEKLKVFLQYAYTVGYEVGNRGTILFDNRVKVDRYDEEGRFLNTYDSITDAANHMKVTQSTMSEAVIRGIRCRNNYWVKQGEEFSLEKALTRLGESVEQGYEKIGTPIEQLNGFRQLIKPFRSINEAAKSVKADRRSIVKACENDSYFKGYFWRYKV